MGSTPFRYPVLGGLLTLFLVSLAGIPRTAFSIALCISAAAVLVLGLTPRSMLEFAERSILSLLM